MERLRSKQETERSRMEITLRDRLEQRRRTQLARKEKLQVELAASLKDKDNAAASLRDRETTVSEQPSDGGGQGGGSFAGSLLSPRASASRGRLDTVKSDILASLAKPLPGATVAAASTTPRLIPTTPVGGLGGRKEPDDFVRSSTPQKSKFFPNVYEQSGHQSLTPHPQTFLNLQDSQSQPQAYAPIPFPDSYKMTTPLRYFYIYIEAF